MVAVVNFRMLFYGMEQQLQPQMNRKSLIKSIQNACLLPTTFQFPAHGHTHTHAYNTNKTCVKANYPISVQICMQRETGVCCSLFNFMLHTLSIATGIIEFEAIIHIHQRQWMQTNATY